MSEMVERVSRALANKMTGWEPDWPTYRYAARAAIEAMRKPTSEMITAADSCVAEGVWGDMIDAALAAPPMKEVE